jgi:hypothetical protein
MYGELFTDTMASWVKQAYVAGPFRSPPFPHSHFNSMMAVKQKNKVRVMIRVASEISRYEISRNFSRNFYFAFREIF